MPEIEHLSYSSVSLYLECARKWRFRYRDNIKAPSNPSLIFGSVFHATIARIHAAEKEGRIPDPARIWELTWLEEIACQEVDWGGELAESLCNEGMRLVSHAVIQEARKGLAPASDAFGPIVERRFSIRVPGVPVPVIGFIDVITRDGVITDMKTAGRAWTQSQAEQESQPLVYLAAANQLRLPHEPGKFRHVVFIKTREPKVQAFTTEHSAGEVLWIFEVIRDVWRSIEAGLFPPNPKACFAWGRQCEYWHL